MIVHLLWTWSVKLFIYTTTITTTTTTTTQQLTVGTILANIYAEDFSLRPRILAYISW